MTMEHGPKRELLKINTFVIGGTLFKCMNTHKYTRTLPDGHSENQIHQALVYDVNGVPTASKVSRRATTAVRHAGRGSKARGEPRGLESDQPGTAGIRPSKYSPDTR